MNAQRYASYRDALSIVGHDEVIETLEPDEVVALRDAAEASLLARTYAEAEASAARAWLVIAGTIRTGRWRYQAGEQLRRLIVRCGPTPAP